MKNVIAADVEYVVERYGWNGSDEIIQAVLERAKDVSDAHRLWDNATYDEIDEIKERAWEIADEGLRGDSATNMLIWEETHFERMVP